MALKVKAVERNIKFTKDENAPGVYRYQILTVFGGFSIINAYLCNPNPLLLGLTKGANDFDTVDSSTI